MTALSRLHRAGRRVRAALVAALMITTLSTWAVTAAPDSKGTDFWLAFPTNYIQTPELRLFLTSDVATSGSVQVPAIGFSTSFSTTPGQITTVTLPSTAQLSSADGVHAGRGVHVTSVAEVSVYGLNRIQFTTDAFLGLPTDILGTEYVVLSHPGVSTNGSEVAVVAPYDGTTVSITPSATVGSRLAGVPYTVTLQRGDAYQLRAENGRDLSGTIITASRPVSVFGGTRCGNVPNSFYGYCDHLVEQLTPANTWGVNFATMGLAGRFGGDTFRFVAQADGTEVYANGSLTAVLNRGQVAQRILSGPQYIASTKPILLAQFANGSTYDGTISDPFMMLIPPYEQFLSQYTVATPASGFVSHYVNLVAPSSAAGAIEVDGVAVPASQFSPIGSSGFSGAQVSIPAGSHNLRGPTPFGAFVYGYARDDSYGYPAGMSLERFDFISERFGLRDSAGWSNDPVNTGTGNFVYPAYDLSFSSTVAGLDVERTYNALDDGSGPLGRGWSLAAQTWLTEDLDGTVWLHQSDGRVVGFSPSSDGGYSRPEEVFASLQRDGDSSLSLHHFDGSVDDFDASGFLSVHRTWDGQATSYQRDANGLVQQASSTTGHSVSYTYANDRLVSVAASDGRSVSYAYDAEGDLASVTDVAGGVTAYDADPRGLVTRITDAAGRLVVANVYDGLRRVSAQELASGARATFSYNITTRVTTVTDIATGEVTRYSHDPETRLVAVTDTTGAVLTKTYNENGDLTQVVDRRSSTQSRTYDSRGNVTAATDAAGGRKNWTYDSQDRVVASTDEVGKTTTYGYSGADRAPSSITDPTGAVAAIEVADGLVRSHTDADGVRSSFSYDAARNVIATADGAGATTSYVYDAAGRIIRRTQPSGAVESYTYDAASRILSETTAAGGTTSYSYDAAGKVTSVADPAGAVTTFTYDAAGNLIETKDALGNVTTSTYNASGDRTSVTKPGGAKTTYDYGPLGRLEVVTDPTGGVTRYGYDNGGNVVATTDAVGQRSDTTYDAKARVVAETSPGGHVRRYSYDAADRLLSDVDAGGATTAYSYDSAGRLVSTTDARGAVTRRTYTPAGRLASETDGAGGTSTYAYDAAGRVSSVTDPLGGVTRSAYDADGRITSETTPSGRTTRYAYDAAGRAVAMTAPGGGVTRRTYTVRGEVATETDPTGGVQAFGYDALSQVIAVTDANGATTGYAYDGRGNRISRTNAEGAVHQWAYDLADRLTSSTDPLGRAATYEYDAGGRLVRAADGSGRAETLEYDTSGRLARQSWLDGTSVEREYDANGRLLRLTDATGVTAYQYDPVGNLLSVVNPRGETVGYSYDLAGRRTSTVYANGTSATFAYDAGGRLRTVDHPATGVTTHGWDADGRLTAESLPGGASRSYDYDAAGNVGTYVQRLAGADRTTSLSYDAAGRITSETTGGATTAYRYDRAGQLVSAAAPSLSTSYSYDRLGRRVSATTNGVVATYAYDAAGQLVREEVDASVRSYSYDDAGRRTGVADGERAIGYAYDARGLLDTATTTTGQGEVSTEGRGYDGDRRLTSVTRTAATGQATTANLVWDVSSPVPEVLTLSSGNGSSHDFVYGANRLAAVAGSSSVLFAMDAHRSTIATASTADLASATGYDAFGNPVARVATVDCGTRPVHPLDPNHCAGDAEGGEPPNVGKGLGRTRNYVPAPLEATGPRPDFSFGYRGELTIGDFVHLRARDYDPSTGSFTTRDPLDGVNGTPTVSNPYHYADNDPLGKVDPLGLRSRDGDFEPDPTPDPTPPPVPPVCAAGIPPRPENPPADEGAGKWNQDPWYSKADDYAVERLAYRLADAADLTGLDNAADNLRHYLKNSGDTRMIDPDDIGDDVPAFARHLSAQAKEAAGETARRAADAGKYDCNVPFTTGWEGFYIGSNLSRDWFYALGGVSTAATGTVTVRRGPPPEASVAYRSHLWDRYNWDAGKKVEIGPITVKDEQLAKLHRAGIAREYDVEGTSSTHRYSCVLSGTSCQ